MTKRERWLRAADDLWLSVGSIGRTGMWRFVNDDYALSVWGSGWHRDLECNGDDSDVVCAARICESLAYDGKPGGKWK